MAIVHNGVTFTGKAMPFSVGTAEVAVQPIAATGVYGIGVLIGPPQGRPISCEYIFDGFATKALLTAAVNSVVAASGRLSGTLIRDGAAADQYPNCVFIGFVPSGPPFYSAGGTTGWVQRGTLHWLQTEVS